jgi:RNA methyltransferase, TrmH family
MTPTITTHRNSKLQALRRLQRRRERELTGLFLAEGEDLIEAASAAGVTPVEGYRTPDCKLKGVGGLAFTEVAPQALAAVSALGSGSRAIAVYQQRWADDPQGPLCLYLHRLSDPGNVGACMRSAHAFGASCVALGPSTADPHSPKAVRASMGAIFALALAKVETVTQLPGATLALAAREGVALERALGSLALPISVLIGAEREGLPAQVIDACDAVAHIPIASESINAAMAATVALYEIDRHFTRVRAS